MSSFHCEACAEIDCISRPCLYILPWPNLNRFVIDPRPPITVGHRLDCALRLVTLGHSVGRFRLRRNNPGVTGSTVEARTRVAQNKSDTTGRDWEFILVYRRVPFVTTAQLGLSS